jgi:hypothetical protein
MFAMPLASNLKRAACLQNRCIVTCTSHKLQTNRQILVGKSARHG